MYLAYWGLARAPFANTHAASDWLEHAGGRTALAKLRHGAAAGGASVLLGPAGVGKSRLTRRFREECRAQGWRTAYFPWARVTPGDIAFELALGPEFSGRLAAKDGRSAFGVLAGLLAECRARGERLLLAVDDLDRADGDDLALWTALTNLTVDGVPAAELLLAGREEAREKLSGAGLLERCAVVARLAPLTVGEGRRYLLERLRAAGAVRPVFTRSSADRLTAFARGRMMEMNRLADLALVAGFGAGATKITPDLVEMAATDLGLSPDPEAAFDATAVQEFPPPFSRPEEEDVLASLPPGA